MADAAIPLLNMLILGSFMAGGAYQLKRMGDEVANVNPIDNE